MNQDRKKVVSHPMIGIVGGLGPEAGRLFHGYVIEETSRMKPVHVDQDHIDVIHFSLSSMIPDRASYVWGKIQENPADEVFRILSLMAASAQHLNRHMYAIVPCNTFHAPRLFEPLLEKVQKASFASHLTLLNMIDESVGYIKKLYPEIQKVGVLGTNTTHRTGIYETALKKHTIELVPLRPDLQDGVEESIYHPDYGLKALSYASDKARQHLLSAVQQLQGEDVKHIILGCTELPLAFPTQSIPGVELIDAGRACAARLIDLVLSSNN
ncbi:MAG: aspartate/glutamate racemase family protein [Holosporales bacterium]